MRGSGGDEHGPDSPHSLDSILVHDLVNSLQIIEGQADLLLDRVEEPTAVDRLTAIKRQTGAANSLIQTIYRMDTLGTDEDFETIDAGRVLEIETAYLDSAYPDAEVSVEVSGDVAVQADDLLASMFRNLVQNAVQHNDSPTPRVFVAAESNDGRTVVVIEDDGPGFPSEAADRLLGVERARSGSGIGVVRALADRYGATISIDGERDGDGEREGEGTTITLEFPIERPSKDS